MHVSGLVKWNRYADNCWLCIAEWRCSQSDHWSHPRGQQVEDPVGSTVHPTKSSPGTCTHIGHRYLIPTADNSGDQRESILKL